MSTSSCYGRQLFSSFFFFFFFNDTATTEIYTLSLHDALPIRARVLPPFGTLELGTSYLGVYAGGAQQARSEEHTSEFQSPCNLVCRLLLEKKKKEHKISYLYKKKRKTRNKKIKTCQY